MNVSMEQELLLQLGRYRQALEKLTRSSRAKIDRLKRQAEHLQHTNRSLEGSNYRLLKEVERLSAENDRAIALIKADPVAMQKVADMIGTKK